VIGGRRTAASIFICTLAVFLLAAAGLSEQAVADANAKHDTAPRTVPNHSAWVADCIYCPVPHYPLDARARHATGKGYFRVTFNLKTGTVEKVTVQQSTGVGSIDNSAVAALRQWRLKPGKWKEILIPIDFRMGFRYPHR
jgi:TonB family protein